MMNKMASIQICSPVTTNGRCQKAHSTPRIRLAMSAEYRNCSRGRAYPLKPGSSHVPARPGIKSDNKNSSKKLDQPPKSATEDVRCAPSKKTLSAAAARVTTIGSRSATAYHWIPTRQRTIRRSNPTTPLLPSVIASTTSAARKGPKPTIGLGKRSKEYRIQGHHDRA